MVRKTSKLQTPLIDGNEAVFIWHGKEAPGLIGDFNHWEEDDPLALKEVEPGVWALTIPFPADAYIEYAYLQDGERTADPGNPHTVFNGVDAANHFFYMPDAKPTGLAQHRRGVPRGVLTRQIVEDEYNVVGRRRNVYFYQPPVEEPCPLLVVFDGQDYLRRVGLTHMIDNLIYRKTIWPVALAMVAHGGRARSVEYACNDATLSFLHNRVLPAAQERLRLVDIRHSPGAYGVLGASMGGLMALYASLRLPHIFGKVLSQSGALFSGSVVYDLLRLNDPKPVKIWMDIGTYDSLFQVNKQMYSLLSSKGYDVTYREFHGGHNYPSWRDDVWRGLEALYGVQQ